MVRLFHLGDRVQTIRTLADLPSGSMETIQHLHSSCDFYDVRFEGQPMARLAHYSDLKAAVGALALKTCEFGPR